jgi:hypothetical protein
VGREEAPFGVTIRRRWQHALREPAGAAGARDGLRRAPLTGRPPVETQAARNFNNIEDGFYISPAFLDKITIHIAKVGAGCRL